MQFSERVNIWVYILLLAFLLSLAKDELVDARRRTKKEKKCSLRMTEDGRYSVVCSKSKVGRKASRKMERKTKQNKFVKPKTSGKAAMLEKTLETTRTVRNKWKRGAMVCRNSLTPWVSKTEFHHGEITVGCGPRELLQRFSLQKLAHKLRYEYTCCSLF
ncbi:uncharacterized protein LOC135680815 [Rhopilema esculentum]|uniref:uncharacterized protein LOC135680815 n=1 Tax=Rhopilema esculentum TaxID=499914 RepID=UPI0031E0E1D1